MIRAMAVATVGISATLVLSSCASITVDALPQPGGTHGAGYQVVIEFANVLNLPDRAKVVQDGTTVGVVTNVALKDDHVDVAIQIDEGVAVPSNIRATLQQSTVLGDTYVALERPEADDTAKAVPAGGTNSPPGTEHIAAPPA